MKGTTLARWLPSFLLIVTVFPSLAKALPQIHYVNKCSYPMYVWPTAQSAVPDSQYKLVEPYSNLSTPMTWPPYGGIAVKIRDVDHYAASPAGILQVEYTFQQPNYFYDLSYIDCDQSAPPESPNHCPFAAGGVLVHTTGYDNGYNCRKLHCQLPGECGLCYLTHGSWFGEPTTACSMDEDLIVETCVDGDGARTYEDTFDHTPPDKECWGNWDDCAGQHDRQQEMKVKRQNQDQTPKKGPRTEDTTPTSSSNSPTSERNCGHCEQAAKDANPCCRKVCPPGNQTLTPDMSYSREGMEVPKTSTISTTSASSTDTNPPTPCSAPTVSTALATSTSFPGVEEFAYPPTTDPYFVYPETLSRFSTVYRQVEKAESRSLNSTSTEINPTRALQEHNRMTKVALPPRQFYYPPIYEDNGVTKTGTRAIIHDDSSDRALDRRGSVPMVTKAAVLPRRSFPPLIYEDNGVTKTGTRIIFHNSDEDSDEKSRWMYMVTVEEPEGPTRTFPPPIHEVNGVTYTGTRIVYYKDPGGKLHRREDHPMTKAAVRPRQGHDPMLYEENGVTKTATHYNFVGTEVYDPYNDPLGNVPYEAGHGMAVTMERPPTDQPVWVVIDGVTTTPPYIKFIGTEIFDPYNDPSGRVPYEAGKGTPIPQPHQPWPPSGKVRRQGHGPTLYEENGATETATH